MKHVLCARSSYNLFITSSHQLFQASYTHFTEKTEIQRHDATWLRSPNKWDWSPLGWTLR